MSLLILIIVVLVLAGLAVWAVRTAPIPAPLNWIIQVLIIVVAILVIAAKAGLL